MPEGLQTIDPSQLPEKQSNTGTGIEKTGRKPDALARVEGRPTDIERPADETAIEQVEQPLNEEQAERQRIDYVSEVTQELQQRDEKRLEKRYGKGLIGKCRRWLNTTDIGRGVKIGAKIVVGTSAAITAGVLTGGVGLVAAPALYGLGLKNAIDGGIEAVQYLAKGRNRRLEMEAAKTDMYLRVDDVATLQSRLETGEINQEQFQQELSNLVKGIADQEQMVIQNENDNIKWEAKQKMIRGVASSVAALGVGILHGVPLGIQHFKGPGHAVRFGRHGFDFIYHASEKMAQSTHAYLGGAVGHTLGHMPPPSAFVGLGAAAIGLFVQTGHQIAQAFNRKEISQPDPKFLQFVSEPQPAGPETPPPDALAKPEPQGPLPVAPERPTAQQPLAERESGGGGASAERQGPTEEVQNILEKEIANVPPELGKLAKLVKDWHISPDKIDQELKDDNKVREGLGLPIEYSLSQFKKVYKLAARFFHPDIHTPILKPKFEAIMKRLNDARPRLEARATA